MFMAGPVGPYTVAPVAVPGIVDAGPSLIAMLFTVVMSIVLVALWARAIRWARRQDQAARDFERIRQLEEEMIFDE